MEAKNKLIDSNDTTVNGQYGAEQIFYSNVLHFSSMGADFPAVNILPLPVCGCQG